MMIRPSVRRSTGCAAAALALVLTPAIASAQATSGNGASLGYKSATDGYRGLDDEPGMPSETTSQAPGTEPGGRPSMPSGMDMESASAPTGPTRRAPGTPADVEVAAVPAPVAKLQASTADRRGSAPGTDPTNTASTTPVRRPGFEYESAFDAYTVFEEREEPDWVGANDNVGKIGGWKTYAREIYESASGDALNDDAESGEGEDE